MTANDLELHDRCPRLSAWSRQYAQLRISPLKALYSALEAGLTGPSASAENQIMELSASPGLDLSGDLYTLAKHYAMLAETMVVYLRGSAPAWVRTPSTPDWTPSTFDCGDSIRRIVLIDHWSDQRKMATIRSWRTIAETSILNRPLLLNFLSIGSTSENRRVSPWSRTLQHPRSKQIRFAKRGQKIDGFADSWLPVWREHWEGTTVEWLGAMQSDNVFDELVHSVRVPVSPRRDEILAEIARKRAEIAALPPNPPPNRSACYGLSPCPFVDVCWSPTASTPADLGWISLDAVRKPL